MYATTSIAPTSGSTMFAVANPDAMNTLWPCERSTAISAVANATSHNHHVRLGVNNSDATVRPAGGKNGAPDAGACKYQNGNSAPIAYKPPSAAAAPNIRIDARNPPPRIARLFSRRERGNPNSGRSPSEKIERLTPKGDTSGSRYARGRA